MTLLKLKVAHKNSTLDIILKVSDVKCTWVQKYYYLHVTYKRLPVLLIKSIDLLTCTVKCKVTSGTM